LVIFRMIYGTYYEKEEGFRAKLKKSGALLCLLSLLVNSAIFANRFFNDYWKKLASLKFK